MSEAGGLGLVSGQQSEALGFKGHCPSGMTALSRSLFAIDIESTHFINSILGTYGKTCKTSIDR